MFIKSIGTAVPAAPVLQEDTLEFVLQHFSIQERTRELYKRTFSNKSITQRHFALEELEHVLEPDLEIKGARFEREAALLSAQALLKALAIANIPAQQLDYVVATTCTGYLCPGLSSYLVESCKLRPDVHLADVVGMGCGAAIPALEQAHNFLKANPGKTAAVVCTEICSAAMFSNDDIEMVISNTIFADGAAAVILQDRHSREGGNPDTSCAWTPASAGVTANIRNFESLLIPKWRDTLRFRTENGHLKNVLAKTVPAQAGQAMRKISETLLEKSGFKQENISRWIMHAGGERVLAAIARELKLEPTALDSAYAVLKAHGNMSSPTVLFVLEEEMKRRPPKKGELAIMGSFGAGFSAYGVLLEWI